MNLTPAFRNSYRDYNDYPINLVERHFYLPVLRAYNKRLNIAAKALFIKDDANADVPFRDLDSQGKCKRNTGMDLGQKAYFRQGISRKNVFSDAKLREQLGDTFEFSKVTTAATGEYATKQDPKCRFM